MKLLFVLPEYLPHTGGGITTFYRHVLGRVAAAGHEVHVLVGSGLSAMDDFAPTTIDGVRVECLRRSLFEAYLPRFSAYAPLPGIRRHLAAAWALWEQAGRGVGYDVVETTDWGLLFAPWVASRDVPCVVQLHGSCGQIDLHDPVLGEELQGRVLRMIEALGLTRADVVQTYSHANATYWRNEGVTPVEVIPPAVPTAARMIPLDARTGRGLVAGRVQRWKGPHVLCEALELLGERAPHIDWYGRDTVYTKRGVSTAQDLAQRYPRTWNTKLNHRAALPPEALAELQAAAPFVVVPSTWDVFNFTCIEAMASGTPVVCSSGAGASGWLEDGRNGFVFENEDPRALANRIARLTAMDVAGRARIVEQAKETLATVLSPERVAAQRLEHWRACVNRGAQARATDDTFRRAVCPSQADHSTLSFLDHLPLKPLARYVAERALRKARSLSR